MASPETFTPKQEKTEQLSEAANERSEALKAKYESSPEVSGERNAEAINEARNAAQHEAQAISKDKITESSSFSKENTAVRRVTKSEKNIAYKETLDHIRNEMSAPEKTFSKIIHNPAVENASDAIGNTLLRPNAILGAGICGFVLSGLVYILARHFGYVLSGFETIGALLVGFILGLLYDFFKTMITGKKN